MDFSNVYRGVHPFLHPLYLLQVANSGYSIPPILCKEEKTKTKTQKEKEVFAEKNKNSLDNLSQNSIIVFNILKETGGASDFDNVALLSSLSVTEVMNSFTELEMEGLLEILPGNRCILR